MIASRVKETEFDLCKVKLELDKAIDELEKANNEVDEANAYVGDASDQLELALEVLKDEKAGFDVATNRRAEAAEKVCKVARNLMELTLEGLEAVAKARETSDLQVKLELGESSPA